MGLKIYKRKTGIYHLRGTHHGERVDESTKTRNRVEAEGVREKRERTIFESIVLRLPKQKSFAEAPIHYMNTEGEVRYLTPILAAIVKVDGRAICFGEIALDDIDEELIYDLARTLKPNAKPSTWKRSIFAPVMAVLNRAARATKRFNYSGVVVTGPEVSLGRPSWKMPGEIEWWLGKCGHVAPLITAYVGTGARASELLGLQWEDVSAGGHTATLWEEDTKSSVARTLQLQKRVRDCWPARSKGHVFLNSAGEPWNDYRAINNFLWRITEREARSAADSADNEELKRLKRLCRTLRPIERPVRAYRTLVLAVAEKKEVPRLHLHSLRHTWATWAYAVTKDITWVKQMGGWASADLVHRYMHSGNDDLGAIVLAHGWSMRGDATPTSIAELGRKQGS